MLSCYLNDLPIKSHTGCHAFIITKEVILPSFSTFLFILLNELCCFCKQFMFIP